MKFEKQHIIIATVVHIGNMQTEQNKVQDHKEKTQTTELTEKPNRINHLNRKINNVEWRLMEQLTAIKTEN